MSTLPASLEASRRADGNPLNVPVEAPSASRRRPANWLERGSRRLVERALSQLDDGELRLVDGDAVTHFGRPGGLSAVLEVHRPRFYRRLMADGRRAACDAYVDGDWTSPDLTAVIRVLARNRRSLTSLDRGSLRFPRWLQLARHWLRRNSRSGARRNIAAHYDLGNEFYALFLDPTMTYSSGVFERADSTLEEASLAKYRRVCEKLELGPRDHVLEIGGGWGGFAEFAARNYGCRVTTTTISPRQYAFARERIAHGGLAHRVEVLQRDYRDLRGRYDKLVSIEMIEAVGAEYQDVYFTTCCRLLKPDGMMLLQAITIPDARYLRYLRDVDFIKQHIFPGGDLPSIGSIGASLGRDTDFNLLHLEDFSPHYARTLAAWRSRFWQNINQVRELGLDERFIRLWDLYLAYCEGGFAERQIGVCQMLLGRSLCRRESILPALATAAAAERSAS